MSWIETVEAGTPFEGVLGQRPELLSRYRAFYRTLWDDGLVSRRLLELCRLRIAAIHGCRQEWLIRDPDASLDERALTALEKGDFSGFAPDERTALAIAEQIPYAHHAITDQAVGALEGALGAPASVALLTAMAFFDVTCRLKLVLDVEALPAELREPPIWQGALV